MANNLKILFIGDTVGQNGKKMLQQYLPLLKQNHKPQVTIVNGENISEGKGMYQKDFKAIVQAGADVVTMGNHTWNKSEITDYIDQEEKLLRPLNFPKGTPGKGYTIIKVNQAKLAVINLQGRALMDAYLDDPFTEVQALVDQIKAETSCIFIDFHAETTSEKLALAWCLDGQVSAVIGTHTHVQTNDARILPQKTAVLTDVGMTGPYNGILGVQKEKIIQRFLTQRPQRFLIDEQSPSQLSGCLLEINDQTGEAKSIQTIQINPDHPYHEF